MKLAAWVQAPAAGTTPLLSRLTEVPAAALVTSAYYLLPSAGPLCRTTLPGSALAERCSSPPCGLSPTLGGRHMR